MRRTGFVVVSLSVGIALLVPSRGLAKGKEHGEERGAKEKAAKKACLLGEVEKGTEILADLFVELNDPTYIYNQGRCFEQNGKNEQAVLRFKEYERKAQGLSQADLDALHKKIDGLQAAAKPQPPPPASPTPTPVAPIDPTASGPLVPGAERAGDPLGIAQPRPQLEPQPTPPVYKRWWFWTGVGAVVAGGVVTAVLLGRRSAPSSPPCDGVGACVP